MDGWCVGGCWFIVAPLSCVKDSLWKFANLGSAFQTYSGHGFIVVAFFFFFFGFLGSLKVIFS
jgi:hypothetical protein